MNRLYSDRAWLWPILKPPEDCEEAGFRAGTKPYPFSDDGRQMRLLAGSASP